MRKIIKFSDGEYTINLGHIDQYTLDKLNNAGEDELKKAKAVYRKLVQEQTNQKNSLEASLLLTTSFSTILTVVLYYVSCHPEMTNDIDFIVMAASAGIIDFFSAIGIVDITQVSNQIDKIKEFIIKEKDKEDSIKEKIKIKL